MSIITDIPFGIDKFSKSSQPGWDNKAIIMQIVFEGVSFETTPITEMAKIFFCFHLPGSKMLD